MEVFVARQPIFDISKAVVGYELLFRDGVQNYFPTGAAGDSATYNVISSSYMSIGFDALTCGKKAFINFTESNIHTGLANLVPQKYLAVEILETVEPTAEIVKACAELKKSGYQIVLDDFVFQAKYQPFIELADIIKIDFLQHPAMQKRHLLRKVIPPRVKLLAEKVETQEDFAQGVDLGYTLFQGFFFSRPVVITYKEIPPNRIIQIQLVQEVNRDDFNVAHLEEVIKRDVSLSYKLFKYVNSAWFGFRYKIQSIKQAIALLGQREVRRWVALVTIRDLSQDKPAELLTTAIIRGRLCEQIAQAAGLIKQVPSAFIVGMFSLLDALLDRPMVDVLSELSLAPEVVAGLMGESTPLGTVLRLAQAYEKADWETLSPLCHSLKLDEEQLPVYYNDAVRWADKMSDV
ncbi:MAG: HDOD domain-containing protein [Negativicutes bacterium]|nr:HDOD domain-containing protein [Negativicutes bacterium]